MSVPTEPSVYVRVTLERKNVSSPYMSPRHKWYFVFTYQNENGRTVGVSASRSCRGYATKRAAFQAAERLARRMTFGHMVFDEHVVLSPREML